MRPGPHEDGAALGGIALRHGTHESIRRAGHLGYGIRPSARGRGLTAWALGPMPAEARSLGIDHVVLVCAAGNVAPAARLHAAGRSKTPGPRGATASRCDDPKAQRFQCSASSS
jgi:predicted acetyltransferase